ncbi:hypothetical protein ACFXKI_09910 [Streptomyces mirabilis]|uniref:hypothetical protein n=1 Tax=Streptomyces mirabilis TaxID=68239 RepID=UPI003693B42A
MTTNPPTNHREQIPLSATERQFLTFALDQAAEEMSLRDGFTADDEAALEKLRRLTNEPPVEAYPAETDFSIEIHDAGRQWLPVGYRRPTLDEARVVRDGRRAKTPGSRFRIVEWTASARVIETDDVPADAEAVTA